MEAQPDFLSQLALLVVDMQDAFLKAIPEPQRSALVRRTTFAVAAARLLGVKIYFTEQKPEKLGGTLPGLLEAAGPEAKVFGKATFSALGAPGLKEAFAEANVEHLLLAGLETPICVYQTTVAALSATLDVTLLSDCLAGRRLDDAEVALRSLAASGAHVLPSESVFFASMATADHPHFRAFQGLVKQYT